MIKVQIKNKNSETAISTPLPHGKWMNNRISFKFGQHNLSVSSYVKPETNEMLAFIGIDNFSK